MNGWHARGELLFRKCGRLFLPVLKEDGMILTKKNGHSGERFLALEKFSHLKDEAWGQVEPQPDPKAAPQLRIHREPAPAEDLPREPHHEEMHHQPWGEADVPCHRHP